MSQSFHDGRVILHAGDCMEVLRGLPDASIDSVCTDPPYGLKFMGRDWDASANIAFAPAVWVEVLRVLKPGGHMVAFSGTRTYHRMACAIEDAGFEIRDQLAWTYGSGFPKSHSVSLAIDKINGAGHRAKAFNTKGRGDRADESDGNGREFPPPYEPTSPEAKQWAGFGTALKPAWEPICLARKPLSEGTVAANVLRWGTGAINVDACRIEVSDDRAARYGNKPPGGTTAAFQLRDKKAAVWDAPSGRFPANLLHDGSPEVLAGFPETSPSPIKVTRSPSTSGHGSSNRSGVIQEYPCHGDSGTAARFFYTSKADAEDRIGSKHPTVKPVDLMQWLVRLITPPGGTVLDPFAGTGTTAEAALREGFRATLIEREAEYQADIVKRMALVFVSSVERKSKSTTQETVDDLPLFAR